MHLAVLGVEFEVSEPVELVEQSGEWRSAIGGLPGQRPIPD